MLKLSSIKAYAERAGLPYDRRNMCKFDSHTSPGYRLVVAALIRYSMEAPEVISRRWKHAVEMLNSQRSQEADELLR
jgi:protein SERAC1